MIQTLTIRNFVLIEELTIRFARGMQALSGETGAGKSIVVDAVNLVLGGRADRSLIRTGSEKATVEAVFDVPGRTDIAEILEREHIEYDGRTVTLYREMTAGGRNLCRVCGVVVPADVLREAGSRMRDIHGQHEHQFLMNPEMHMAFLDRTGTDDHREQMRKTEAACEAFLETHRMYARMKRENDRKQQRMAELEKDLAALHAARIRAGEEKTLQEECLRLRNAEKIAAVLRDAREKLSYGETESSSLEKIRAAADAMNSLAAYGEAHAALGARIESAYYELEEAAYEISRRLEELESDPGRLEKNEERLDLIRRMERKYGATEEAVLTEQKRMEAEYAELCSLEDRIDETGREHRALLAAYRAEARELTESRKRLAAEFERRMTEQLKDLGMEKTVFSVAFEEPKEGDRKPMPRPVGDDRISFLISPNPGEPLRPLDRIASGGELSRLMLAMKTLEAEGTGVDCMVFDEIDTGISGRMAQAVAEKMHAIAGSRQVICVTHLPQIAAAADEQYLVEKTVAGGRTSTGVTRLDRAGRIREVARMIGGAEGSIEGAETYAEKMLQASENTRKD